MNEQFTTQQVGIQRFISAFAALACLFRTLAHSLCLFLWRASYYELVVRFSATGERGNESFILLLFGGRMLEILVDVCRLRKYIQH